MTKLVWKGKDRIIQEDGQSGEEATYLLLFEKTKEGQKWFDNNKITEITKDETPDYIFKTEDNKTVGLEITNLYIETDKKKATSRLRTIANQVCQDFKQTEGIALTILIDPVNKSLFARTYREMLEAAYNPGFDTIEGKQKEIKNKIIDALSQGISPNGILKTSIEIGTQIFKITATRWEEPHTQASVNNQGICKKDPFEELQDTITKKNKKFDNYKYNCDECNLLVVCDNDSNGNFVHISDKIKFHKFESSFRSIYLLDLSIWYDSKQAVKLKIVKLL